MRAFLHAWAPPPRREHRAHRFGRGGPGVQGAELTPLPSPKDLVNIEMFLTAKEVEESLERRETATCLAWCHDNKSRLRKMKVCGRGAGLAPSPVGAEFHASGSQGGGVGRARGFVFGLGVWVLGKIPEKCTPFCITVWTSVLGLRL